ncbi:hypothetical protein H257_03564 [Aphanomyces astaci]|uniref:Uncharacterized protein n=1 Tax=Aphanomyces astaci TaxID=112090 RepID=W4GZ81_APHAT|nr:hypothetical protein H257_03564 [Aphanomyces astaci]ETV84324.1 hypothetical protein H257_03564 [Aphanomyces astaci]|eukprot:XP_009826016.1 hypothetical protein H257_03564 [Aphanomyces astaci]
MFVVPECNTTTLGIPTVFTMLDVLVTAGRTTSAPMMFAVEHFLVDRLHYVMVHFQRTGVANCGVHGVGGVALHTEDKGRGYRLSAVQQLDVVVIEASENYRQHTTGGAVGACAKDTPTLWLKVQPSQRLHEWSAEPKQVALRAVTSPGKLFFTPASCFSPRHAKNDFRVDRFTLAKTTVNFPGNSGSEYTARTPVNFPPCKSATWNIGGNTYDGVTSCSISTAAKTSVIPFWCYSYSQKANAQGTSTTATTASAKQSFSMYFVPQNVTALNNLRSCLMVSDKDLATLCDTAVRSVLSPFGSPATCVKGTMVTQFSMALSDNDQCK